MNAPTFVDLTIRLTPRSSQSRLRVEDGVWSAWVNAPPVDGQANEALVRLVAKTLGVGVSQVEIVRGHTSRVKVVRVTGITLEEAAERASKVV